MAKHPPPITLNRSEGREMSWTKSKKNGRVIVDLSGDKIATAERQNNAPDAWKNAALIAAAPDLLEACKAAADVICNHESGHCRTFADAFEKLTTAISKAEQA